MPTPEQAEQFEKLSTAIKRTETLERKLIARLIDVIGGSDAIYQMNKAEVEAWLEICPPGYLRFRLHDRLEQIKGD